MSFLLRKPENAAWKFISCFLKRLTPRGKRVAENAGAGSGTGGTGDGSGVGSAWGGSGSGSGMGLGRTSGPPAVGKSSGDISFPALQLRHGSRTIIKSHPALGLADDVIQHERGGNEGDECHHPRRSQRVRHSSRLSAHEDGVSYIHGVPIHGSSAAIRAKATMTATINVTTTRIPLVRSTTSLTNSVCIMSSRRIAASLPAKSSSGNKGRQE